jgi:thiopurine S-methyltransferase
MQHEFWHQRWQQNQIGFHSEAVNPHLQQQWATLALKPNSRVFVPMCGKSNDMLWLLAQGHQVVGVELSPLAVEAFFAENGLQPSIRQQGHFVISEIDGLQIFCGDFFALQPADLGAIDAVYDRAALVALPDDMRISYAATLSKLLNPGTKILLVTFEYPQPEMAGPPFCVAQDEVELLYQAWCQIDLLESIDIGERDAHFKARGVSWIQERVYQLAVL